MGLRSEDDWLWEELLDIKYSQTSQGGAVERAGMGMSTGINNAGNDRGWFCKERDNGFWIIQQSFQQLLPPRLLKTPERHPGRKL